MEKKWTTVRFPLDEREELSELAWRARTSQSPKTTRNALGFLHSIFEFSRRKGWARANPCKLVDKPRTEAKAEIHFLDAEELEAVVRAERGREDVLAETLGLMYRTAAMTGLRQGELIALRWRDVDWSAGRLRVRRS